MKYLNIFSFSFFSLPVTNYCACERYVYYQFFNGLLFTLNQKVDKTFYWKHFAHLTEFSWCPFFQKDTLFQDKLMLNTSPIPFSPLVWIVLVPYVVSPIRRWDKYQKMEWKRDSMKWTLMFTVYLLSSFYQLFGISQ